ncbi:DUF4843 domain-containing protein [Pedobacter gandavensis]|uniref:DUF4843 domain-containing protein n=1 Tax=Pedobacter gandavensis TaxID=2679963 RepID=UPI00292DC0CA|nr:DUF4843 domain-containing protein [Pedobacter gandavensis]
MKKLLTILMVFGIFAACKKESLQAYTEKPRIYFRLEKKVFYLPFPTATAGNLRIDYLPQNSIKKTDTLALIVQASGPASDNPRAFVLERSAKPGNAVEGVDFDLLDKDFVIPAGAFNKAIRVVVRRTSGMTKNELSFAYNLKMNEHFELGPLADTTNYFSNEGVTNMVAINFVARDIAIKPANWDTFLLNYFGAYSEVKYRFIIDVLAKISFPSDTQAAVMTGNRTRLRTALTKFNTGRPEKLKDENGIEISF